MMHKLMLLSRIILTGLSIALFCSGCKFLAWDYPDDRIKVEFKNSTASTVLIVLNTDSLTRSQFETFEDSLVLVADDVFVPFDFVAEYNDESVVEAVEILEIYTIKIYESNVILKIWEGPSDYYGDSIHSPFNYDSWEIRPVEENPENVVGAVTFTITEEDLE